MTEERREDRVSHIENKVSRLEAAVENTQSSIRSLAENTEKQISSLAITTEHQIERLALTINKMSEHQFTNQRTNWSQIWAAAGVLIILFGSLIGGFVLNPQHQMDAKVVALEENYTHHISDGHPKTVLDTITIKYDNVHKLINFNATSQNIIHSNIDAELNKLFKWKNEWVSKALPVHSELSEKVQTIENEVAIQTKHRETHVPLLESHEERLRGLERQAYPDAKYRGGRP